MHHQHSIAARIAACIGHLCGRCGQVGRRCCMLAVHCVGASQAWAPQPSPAEVAAAAAAAACWVLVRVLWPQMLHMVLPLHQVTKTPTPAHSSPVVMCKPAHSSTCRDQAKNEH
eukprot:1139642-Pelagomonas_calceolata.AAC.1